MQTLKDLAARPRNEKQNEILLWIAIGLASLLLFWAGLGASSAIFPKPKIGIIYVDRPIGAGVLPYFTIPMRYAVEHPEIAAVVLVVDSPGGTAATSEELFYRMVDLRNEKPVVTSVNRLAASGSYYMSIGTNYIYAKPAALVGSVGVISGIPSASPGLNEFEATTGPFKGSGATQVDWIRGLEAMKNAFASNVYDQRLYILERYHDESRADLLPDKDHISTGQVWPAPMALEIGLIDALGSDLDAIRKAGELAHVANYDVVDLTRLVFIDDGTFVLSADIPEGSYLLDESDYIEAGPWPSFYHLYIPPED
jgi:protease-4